MTAAPLRCHLLIGPPGSGKTTLAHQLAPLLQGENGEPGVVLSTDAIREELFGDAAVQGPWDEIRALLLQRLHAAVEAGTPVVIDATHARRPWRLLYTQQLQLPRPVEWIGWWLKTPEATCLEWVQRRDRPVPEAVVNDFYTALAHKDFGPGRAEGFAAIVPINPANGESTPETITKLLASIDGRIRNAVNRDRAKEPFLHRYSRLLDLERLLFLVRLLTSFNGLDSSDPGTAAALLEICNPPPQGDVAQRAAAYLASWKEVHGGNSECYGDAGAIRSDLTWLRANGFISLSADNREPIACGTGGPVQGSSVNGGYPALAERPIFRRVFTLLRHILQEPFDAPDPDLERQAASDAAGESPAPRAKGSRRSPSEFGPLYRYLIDNLSEIEGSYAEAEESVLRYDLEHVLRAYGFLPKVKGRPHQVREGYAIGTALLSAEQLLEIHALLKASLGRLSDASQKPILESLESRLKRAGVLDAQGEARRYRHPKRAVANRSLTVEKRGTLADPEMSARVERAIRDRRRIWLKHDLDSVSEAQKQRGDDGRFRAWPLQLLFHNISWYLAFETAEIGREPGLIRTLRVDRLVMLSEDGNIRRPTEAQHEVALHRLQRLLHLCGGLYLGDDIDRQLAIAGDGRGEGFESDVLDGGVSQPVIPGAELYDLVRFSCTPAVFQLIREEPRRFPPEHTAYSKPIAGQSKWDAGPLDTLDPNPVSDSHPYPVEIRLPRWTVERDWDLRNWLFRWGAGIRIEQPIELREHQLQQAREVVALYSSGPANEQEL